MGQYGRGGVASSSRAKRANRGPRSDSAAAHVAESADEFMTSEEMGARDAAVKMANKSLVYPAHMSGTRGKKKKRFKRRKAFKAAHAKKVRHAINQVGRLRKVAAGRALIDWQEQGRGSAKAYKRGTPAQILAARDTSNDNRRNDQLLRQHSDFGGKTTYSDAKARKALRNSRVNGATIKYSDRSTAGRAARERGDKRDNWRAGERDAIQFGGVSSAEGLHTRNSIFNAQRGRFGAQWGDTPETRLDTRDEFLGFGGSDRDQVKGGLGPRNRTYQTWTKHKTPTYKPTAAERKRGAYTTTAWRTDNDGRGIGIDNAERAFMNFAGGTRRS